MEKDKNNKKNRVEKLRLILDTPENKKLYPGDEKHLKALSRRLKESSDEGPSKIKVRYEGDQINDDLKPRVKVYPRVVTKKVTKVEFVEEDKTKIVKEKKKEITIKDEDIFEIEKIKVRQNEFVQVKQKELEKPQKETKNELKEWENVEVEEPKVKPKEEWESVEETKKEEIIEIEREQVETEDSTFIEVKKAPKKEFSLIDDEPEKLEIEEPLEKEDAFKEVSVEGEFQTEIEDKIKIEAFKEINSIDDKTAIKLYNSGFTSLGGINLSDTKDLAYLTGIKKSQAKKIKKEVENKLKSKNFKEQPLIEGRNSNSDEIIKDDIDDDAIIAFEEKPLKVDPIDVSETGEWEVTADEISDVEDVSMDYVKINAFKDMKSIDDNTAILLYDNGYASIEELKMADKKDLKKIKGLKRKQIKEIIEELEEKIIEAAKTQPIDNGIAGNAELNEDFLEEEKEVEEEKIELTDALVELDSRDDEWIPLPEDSEDDKKEKIADAIINNEEVIDEDKINVFKALTSVDDVNAIMLYDNGIKSINSLKNTPVKKISKILGIKKSEAKNIVNEAKEFKPKSEEELEIELIEEGQIDDYEIEIIDETPEVKKEYEVFKEIKSIDDKIAQLLLDNGIDSIEILKQQTIKDLTSIKGIRKKVAKEIKKEAEAIVVEEPKKEKKKKSKKKTKSSKKKKIGEQYYIQDNNKDQGFVEAAFGNEFSNFKYGEFKLYEKEIETKSNKRRIVRFFSKDNPKGAHSIELPEGYEVKENGTGVPYLKKKNK